MITKEEWRETENFCCFSCKRRFPDTGNVYYGIRCGRGVKERNIWYCEKCWLEIAGEEYTFWDFSKEKS